MNRKIKFRIWNGERFYYSGNFENINFRTSGDVFRVWLNGDDPNNANRYILIDSENPLEQYTGLKDKNGKEAYRADLAMLRVGGCEYIREIYQAESGAWCVDLPVASSTNEVAMMLFSMDFEIIGNIHETPSLLDSDQREA